MTTSVGLSPISFRIAIGSKEQFYQLVRELNHHCGPGKENWTLRGRILKHFKSSEKVTVNTVLDIYNRRFSEADFLYTALKLNVQIWR